MTHRAVLLVGTNLCADCGVPYTRPGLISRCQPRHEEPPRPATARNGCTGCGFPLDAAITDDGFTTHPACEDTP